MMVPQIRMTRNAALLLAVFGLAITAMISSGPAVMAKDQILTKRSVELFLASYPDVKAVSERHARQKGVELAGAADQLAGIIEVVSDDSIANEVDSVVQSHGFADAKQWLSIARSVARAYAHLRVGTKVRNAGQKLEKAITKIEKNDFLSDKQKAKLIKALREGAGDLLEEPPEENVAMVQLMQSEIDAVIFR